MPGPAGPSRPSSGSATPGSSAKTELAINHELAGEGFSVKRLAVLSAEFVDVTAEVVGFPNPLQDREATNTVYPGHL